MASTLTLALNVTLTGHPLRVMEMARAFPDAWFRGIDIGSSASSFWPDDSCLYLLSVPIATRYPLDNVQFELQDISSTPYRWGPGTVDLIHARDMALAVTVSYDAFRIPSLF